MHYVTYQPPRLILWLNTHNPSLRNLNQDECKPTAWVIPGLISFSSQEQVNMREAHVFLLLWIDVFNTAENDLDFTINAQAHRKWSV